MTNRQFRRTAAAWLPEVPVDWSMVPAKALFANRNEMSRANDVHLTPSQRFGVVSQEDYMQLSGSRVVLNLSGADRMKHVEEGDFVSHLRSFQGGLERSSLSGKVSAAYTVLAPRESVVGNFFRYLLKCDRYVEALRVTTDQLRDGQSIRYKEFGDVPLPLPSVAAQLAISDFLDRETAQIDAMIEAQRTLAVRLVERRSALIWQSVTKGVDDASHRPSAVEWIGDVPEHWQVNRLKTAIESVQSGVWGEESRGDATDIRCVRVADFDRARLGVAKGDTTLRSVPMSDQARFGLRCGDLLLEKSGGTGINPVGFMAMYDSDEPAVCSNFIGRVRLRARQHPRYWLYACAASYLYRLTHRSVKQTTGIQNLDIGSYFNEPFPFPPFKEQVQIAAWLDATAAQIDAVIAASKDAITLMQERRAALISAAVTGRIDPRTGKEVRLDDLALDLV